MRIIDLQLAAFGPFTDVQLDFSDDRQKLSIVYGPNEAGKSSSLRAITAALFGIPQKSSDNFLHDYKAMRVGAALLNGHDDAPFRFLRRKGHKNTILHPDTGSAFPEGVLTPFLGGLDSDTFSAIYAVGKEELERGGRQLQQLNGLVGESLLAAGLGGGNLSQVLSSLDDDAAEILGKSHRNKSILGVAKSAYDDAFKERRDRAIPSSKWQEQSRQLDQARAKRDQVVQHMDEVRTRQIRLQRVRHSLSLLVRRNETLAQIDALGAVTELPDNYSTEERAKIQSRLEDETREISLIRERLDGENGLRQQAAGISIPDGFLENEAAIQDLQQRLGAVLRATTDRDTTLASQRDALMASLRRIIRDVRPDLLDAVTGDVPQMEKLNEIRIPSDRVLVIQNLGNHQANVEQNLTDHTKAAKKIASDIVVALKQLETLPETIDVSRLQRACQAATKVGNLTEQISTKASERAISQTDADEQLSRLGLWQGSLAQLLCLPVPAMESIDRFEDDFRTIDSEQSSLASDIEEASDELLEIDRQIQSLERMLGVLTESELYDHRILRDQLWQRIQQLWLNDEFDRDTIATLLGDPSLVAQNAASRLAARFASELAMTDTIADGLKEKAHEVAQLTSTLDRRKRIAEKLDNLTKRHSAAEQKRLTTTTLWHTLWADSRIEPLTPREMRAWLQRQSELLRAAGQISAMDLAIEQLQQTESRFGQLVREQLPGKHADCDLAALLEIANETIASATSTAIQRENLQLSLKQLTQFERENVEQLGDAEQERSSWQQQWSVAMRQIGLDETTTSAQANQRLSQLDEIAGLVDKIEDVRIRVSQIDELANTFDDAVRQLTCRLAPNLSDIPTTQAASQLQTQLAIASRDHVRLQGLEKQIDDLATTFAQKTVNQQTLQQQLTHFRKLARVSETDDLSELEAASRKLTDCRAELNVLDERILELGAGMSIEDIIDEANDQNVDQLDAALARTAEEFATIQKDRDDAVSQLRELEKACETNDTTSMAAEADQRALGILSRMQADSERYIRLRAASAILRQQIERHRTENQDPILARASNLFSRITCEEFQELRPEFNESDQASIVGVRRRSRQVVTVDAMSDGTRDQLYLALRLGYLEARIGHNPMPLVVDDILIGFDNERARATLEVLAELAEQTQVIFFTHHQHLVDLATESIADRCRVHHLDSRRKSLT